MHNARVQDKFNRNFSSRKRGQQASYELSRNLISANQVPASFKAVAVQEARELVHDLRNRVTSLTMSAAIIYIKCGEPANTKQFIEQVDTDGKLCGEYLTRMAKLLK